MFIVLLLLFFPASHVLRAVTGLPANTPTLPQLNQSDGIFGQSNGPFANNVSDSPNEGYSWVIPDTEMSIHMMIPPNSRPLDPKDISGCLRNYINFIGRYFQPEDHLTRYRDITFDSVQAALSPYRVRKEYSITYRKVWKVLVGLWDYIWREKLLVELDFKVVDRGIFVAWGTLRLRDEEPLAPSTPSKPESPPLPTAVQ